MDDRPLRMRIDWFRLIFWLVMLIDTVLIFLVLGCDPWRNPFGRGL